MKKLLSVFAMVALLAVAFAQPSIPTRLFDVRNGNGIIDSGVTYPQATVIVYKDAASKNKIIDSFAASYGYTATIPDPANPQATIPNPQSKQAFMNKKITEYLRDVHKSVQLQAAADAAKATANTSADAELP